LLVEYGSILTKNAFLFKKKTKKKLFSQGFRKLPCWFFFWNLQQVCKISYGFGQYFNNPKNFNSWKLMINILIQMLDLQIGWYLNIRSWLENFLNYFRYSLILIESIFHCNIRVMKNSSTIYDWWTLLGHLHRFFTWEFI